MDTGSQGPSTGGDIPLLPARMVNEFAYCPRLAYFEWVDGEFADNAETTEGRFHHRRVDQAPVRKSRQPENQEAGESTIHQRSVWLSSERLGVTAKIDLVEGEGQAVVPVDYKRGKRPQVARGAYEPERVQLCAQALLLEAHGYTCSEGVLYFVASRERVPVVFDDALREATRQAAAELRLLATGARMPPPL